VLAHASVVIQAPAVVQVCNVWPMHLAALGWHATHAPLKQTEVAPAHAACATHCPPVHVSGTIVGEHSTAFSVHTGGEPLDAPLVDPLEPEAPFVTPLPEPVAPGPPLPPLLEPDAPDPEPLEGEPLDVPLVVAPDAVDPEVAPLDPLLSPVVASLPLLGESAEAASMSAPETPDWPDVAPAVPPVASAEGPLDPLEALSVVVPFAHAAKKAPKPSQPIRLMSLQRLACSSAGSRGAREVVDAGCQAAPRRTYGSAVVGKAPGDERGADAIHTHARSKSCKGARCKAPPLATETSSSSRER
jgi:hypothetical protein